MIFLSDKWNRYGKTFCPVAVNILVVIFWVILVMVCRVTTVVTMLINLMKVEHGQLKFKLYHTFTMSIIITLINPGHYNN